MIYIYICVRTYIHTYEYICTFNYIYILVCAKVYVHRYDVPEGSYLLRSNIPGQCWAADFLSEPAGLQAVGPGISKVRDR